MLPTRLWRLSDGGNSVLNRIFCVCAVGALLCFSGAANAVTFTYNITLTEQIGTVGGGTGQFVIDGATNTGFFQAPVQPPGFGILSSLQFNIDGHIFTLSDAVGGFGQVGLSGGGALTSVTYTGLDGGNISISLNAGALSYVYSDPDSFSLGLISAVLAPAG